MSSLAGKIALAVSLISLAFGGVAALLGLVPFLFVLTLSGVVYLSVSVLVRRLVVMRLRRLESALDGFREESGRQAATRAEGGDELDVLARKSDQAQHAVSRRLAAFNRTDDYRREYIGDISHELKTPIFAIQGFAETLLEGALADPEVNRGFVNKILQNAGRLRGLVQDLSEISRLETGDITVTPEAFSLVRLATEVKESLELVAAAENVDLRVEVPASADSVEADRERIRQVLSNLMENGIKYNRPGGWVSITAARREDRVEVAVKDGGIGIAPRDIPRVTERFFRTEKSRSRPQGGSGLGLSIVKHILAAHGTTLHVESELERGSRFSFTLRTAGSPVAR